VLFRHAPILLVKHIQRFAIERQIRIVNAVRQLPVFGVKVNFGLRVRHHVAIGDEVILLVFAAVVRHLEIAGHDDDDDDDVDNDAQKI